MRAKKRYADKDWSIVDWVFSMTPGGLSEARDSLICALDAAYELAPRSRTVVTVLEQERPWWESILKSYPMTSIVEQPIDRGSAIAGLMAALRVRDSDPGATLHFFGRTQGNISLRCLMSVYRQTNPELLARSVALLSDSSPCEPGALDSIYPFIGCLEFGQELSTTLRRVGLPSSTDIVVAAS